jgi:methionyl-tRNA formyltransferase
MEIVFAVTNPDKPFGRDQLMRSSPVKEVAIANSIPVLQPAKIRNNEDFLDQIRAYECDYFIVVAYGKIVPLELLQIPRKVCINVHGSILPAYRGASPIQAALLN